MNRPAKEEEPKDDGEHELENRHSQPSLNELSESGDEDAANSGDDISC